MTQSRRSDNKTGDKKPVLSGRMRAKLHISLGILLVMIAALLVRVYYIQKNNEDEYNKIVLTQRQSEYSSKTLPARRGDIYDRNGNRLATSEKVYILIIDPAQMIDEERRTSEGLKTYNVIEPVTEALSSYFGIDKNEIADLIEDNPSSRYIRLKKDISYDDKNGFLEYQSEKNAEYSASTDALTKKKKISGIWFEDSFKRTYSYGSLACNVIGFSNSDGTGGTGGVEQYYNDYLSGVNGREYGYLDDDADLEKVVKSAVNGNTLVLTIDSTIQQAVEDALDEWKNGDIGSKSAACIVMNPKNGEVLAMASTNSFDLNDPSMGLTDSDEMNRLWRNICVSDTYEPGSTQKIFTVAGALEEGVISKNDTFECEGYVQLSDGVNNWKINCVNRNGHGTLDVTGGITNSCNVVMMNIAFNEGAETFVKYEKIFGFGEYTGIDLPAEADTSKLSFNEDSIGRTQLATNSFGQNYNCTMIQMAAAYCSVINGGNYYKPHVVKQILTSDGTLVKNIDKCLVRETVSKSTCDYLKEALFETVETGTGKAAQVEGYTIGGKTGTAQKLPRTAGTYVVSFCGFAPVDDPELLCYVIVDEPSLPGEEAAHSSFASGIFAKVMAEALPAVNLYPEGTSASEYRAAEYYSEETETDEYIQGENDGGELPDMLTGDNNG